MIHVFGIHSIKVIPQIYSINSKKNIKYIFNSDFQVMKFFLVFIFHFELH